MLQTFLGSLSFFKPRPDDDFVDRLHYFMTTNVLIGLSILVSWKQFGGKPIECMVPDMFSGAWEQYAEQFCWAKNTYFLPLRNPKIPEDVSKRQDSEISYYQWVPFFLLIEAGCFYLPSVFWKLMAGRSGLKISNIIRAAASDDNLKYEVRQGTVKTLTCHLENALRFHRRLERRHIMPHTYLRVLNLQYSACYVTVTYLIMKALYLINVVGQWILLNNFMETSDDGYYGFNVIQDLVSSSTWEHTGVFPRVTLCDFEVRAMGSRVQRFTIQCVLVINLFNEKIFVFLWFWYLFLMILTAGSFVYWFLLMVLPWPSRWFVSLHLELSELPFDRESNRRYIDKFVSSYLKLDGVFVLRMITMHTGVILTTDLIMALWKRFYGIEEQVQRKYSTALSEGRPRMSAESDTNRPGLTQLRLRLPKRLKGSDSSEAKNAGEMSAILDKLSSNDNKPLIGGDDVFPSAPKDDHHPKTKDFGSNVDKYIMPPPPPRYASPHRDTAISMTDEEIDDDQYRRSAL